MTGVARIELDRRKLLLGLGLAGFSGLAQARLPVPNRPRIDTDDLSRMIPERVGEFDFDTISGLILPPSDALSDRLYDNLVTRSYKRADGTVVMLLLAYNNRQDGVLQIHRPEICYPAGGFVLTPTAPLAIALPDNRKLPVQAFAARGDNRNEVILYWTRVGTTFPRGWSDQRLAVARANLSGVVPDGILVRISTFARDVEAELPLLSKFMSDLYRRSPPKLRGLMFGSN